MDPWSLHSIDVVLRPGLGDLPMVDMKLCFIGTSVP